ncbi:2-succinyl-5-enolpyruvyl-6-hydroxy-3-cyclohexene-1-carboxylic-acid synthase [Leucobacter sp. cx-42]|uniref:2-succinyl-5-enolpyruvyl-6-hydroxy-3- cyclohexene-1-carboxylic-acid synthase n=1 Tax=unclassified Leucobacter TaxID=2621730 RepID=UPI00165DA425|nr:MULTISPECIES: 2-succinyl-5-enolpyruvyl-6-hydroxy-3-cyclohexene-1-carboxylic-acid synthase [unclassified Leucobacter]MBC9954989.1 2-succinyl-5-enolpyruvyl-6-hydroxy-3-cyclohexene-1-carboxylic-acid synthase [Leucobacter sp. cx-42]
MSAGSAPAAPAPASIFAVELLAGLIRRGVQDIVVCPGSRSQALALAAADAERAGAIRLHVRHDERAAAFFALGLSRETGLPAPVVVTSGTAVANLAPAALEAHEGRVPFIALSADRPADKRGTRASQTTLQYDMFGAAARLSRDVAPPESQHAEDPDELARDAFAAALGRAGGQPAGPVQLNLQFREPLSGTAGFEAMIAGGFAAAAEEGAEARTIRALEAGNVAAAAFGTATINTFTLESEHDADAVADARTVVIAGAAAGTEATDFARAAGLPLLGEVVSGCREGDEAITAYAVLIDQPALGGTVNRAIVFGHPTLTRQIGALVGRADVETIVVDPHVDTDHYDPARSARIVRHARVAPGYDRATNASWLAAWQSADRAHAVAVPAIAAGAAPSRRSLVAAVWNSTAPTDRLMLAASRLVRVLDGVAAPRTVDVRSNRGLAGIDGTIATAAGIAFASQSVIPDSVTRLLIGDVALLHDATSLFAPAGEQVPRMQIILGNDGGGTIFDGLEVASSAERSAYERVMFTPQTVNIAALATAAGWQHILVETQQQLEEALAETVTDRTFIEVALAR